MSFLLTHIVLSYSAMLCGALLTKYHFRILIKENKENRDKYKSLIISMNNLDKQINNCYTKIFQTKK